MHEAWTSRRLINHQITPLLGQSSPRCLVVWLQEGCEYLIHTDSAGRLTLQDCFVHDFETDIYAEPEFSGRMPDAPMRYAEVPWIVQFFGDRVYNKAPWQRVSS